jgi:hypothetical protein
MASRTYICNAGNDEEDPTGSVRVPTAGINLPHLEVSGDRLFLFSVISHAFLKVFWYTVSYPVLLLKRMLVFVILSISCLESRKKYILFICGVKILVYTILLSGLVVFYAKY